MSAILLQADNVTCRREIARNEPSMARNIHLEVEEGSQTALQGETGCGKLVLLHLLGLLESPDEGEIIFARQKVSELEMNARTDLRNRHIGILLDEPGLLPGLTVAENIAMPMFKILEIDPPEARLLTEHILAELCIEQYQDVEAGDLPRFEQHLVSLARALAVSPVLFIAESGDHHLTEKEQVAWQKIVSKVITYHGLTLVRIAGPAETLELHTRLISMANGVIIRDQALCRASNH